MSEQKTNITTLWNYNQLNQELPGSVEAIVVPGCRDLSVVDCAVELYHEGRAELIVMSGKNGPMTRGDSMTEAARFELRALDLGVDQAAIRREERSENTGDNIRFSQQLVADELGRQALSIILVQKPYLERRLLATFDKQWGAPTQGSVTSLRNSKGQPMSFDDYVELRQASERDIAQYLVDTTKRIIEYPEQGFQTEQPMDATVRQAYEELASVLDADYDSQWLTTEASQAAA